MKEEKDWFSDFVDFVVKEWKAKTKKTKGKTWTAEEEERSRFYIEEMADLLMSYRFKCLINTLCDVDDLMEKFNDLNPNYFEEESKNERK